MTGHKPGADAAMHSRLGGPVISPSLHTAAGLRRSSPVYLSITLPFDTSVAGVARREVTGLFGDDAQAGSISLVCSELATNAFRHGSPPILLKVLVDQAERTPAVEITVTDGGPGYRPAEADAAWQGDESGRGHIIVKALTKDFSLHIGASCSRAWCRLPLTPAPAIDGPIVPRARKESRHDA